MEKTLKPWLGDGKAKEIKWKDIIGLSITKLVIPWKDEEGTEFWYAMKIRTKKHVYLYNHYIDDDADTRADIALYLEHLAKIWKGEEQI